MEEYVLSNMFSLKLIIEFMEGNVDFNVSFYEFSVYSDVYFERNI